MTPPIYWGETMSGVDSKPEKREDPFKRALDYVKNFEKIDGTDPQELLEWFANVQMGWSLLAFVLFKKEKEKRKASRLCFLGTADIVTLIQYCPRKGLLSLLNKEPGYFLKWAEIKYNSLRIHGGLNDEQMYLAEFLFDITTNDTIGLLPSMNKEHAIKTLRRIAEWKKWAETNHLSLERLFENLYQLAEKITESPEPTKEDLETCLKEEESNFSPKRKPLTEEDIAVIRSECDTEDQVEGWIAEHELAERYPTIPLCMTVGNRIIVGVPDGITSKFIYEFKRTKKKRYLKYVLEDARLQAYIYSALLFRPEIRLHVHVADPSIPASERDFKVIENADPNKGLEAIHKAINLIEQYANGKIPPKTSNKNKCLHCEFKSRCDALDEKLNRNKKEDPSRSQETLSF
jgi:CRISPR/Cas system-associated exonuclease Cas4 (RecB family)